MVRNISEASRYSNLWRYWPSYALWERKRQTPHTGRLSPRETVCVSVVG